MTGAEIFPAAEGDGCEPFRDIALYVGCHENDVHDAFSGLDVPEWLASEHHEAVKERAKSFNRAARSASSLLTALRSLSNHDLQMLEQSGAVTLYQLEHLHWALEKDNKDLKDWLAERGRPGGKNIAAYEIAEGIRRLFRRRRLNVAFGQSPNSGDPSTKFGQTVERAIAAFGLVADWRGPAKAAKEKQSRIEGRLFNCQVARAKAPLNTKSEK